jgi:hypothetical protein
VSARSIRALILCAVAVALALPLAGELLPLHEAFAVPCRDCSDNDGGGGSGGGGGVPDPVPAPSPDPETPPGGGTTPGPVLMTERETHTLSVETDRGRVIDGSGIDCPRGACSRSWTYERTCSDGDCPAYHYLTITLILTPEAGYTAKWDGCTPRPAEPAKCDVLLDRDRAVRVLWTKGDPPFDPQPLRDGGAVVPGDSSVAPGTVVSGTVETPAVGRRGAVRSTVRYSFRRSATWTEFTLLKIRHIPAGATARVTCRGTRCPNGASVSTRSGSLKLNRFTGRRYAVATAITIRVTHPRKRGRTTKMVVRKGKDPRITHP